MLLLLLHDYRSRGQSSRLARETSLDAGEETGSRPARGRPAGKKRGRKPGSKNKDKSTKEKEEAQSAAIAAVSTEAIPLKDKESRGKDKELNALSDREHSIGRPGADGAKEKETNNKDKDKENEKEVPPSNRESDAETEDDVAMGLDEEDDEPSPEKKQPTRGRKKRKGPVPKGGPGAKRKRASAKEKEAAKEGEDDADSEQDEDMDVEDIKDAQDGAAAPKRDKDEHIAGKKCGSSKRDSGGNRDKQHQHADNVDDHKKKEDKKSSPTKETDKVNDDKGASKGSDEHEKDTTVKESPSVGGKGSAGKGSSGSKESKETKEFSPKEAERTDTKCGTTGRRERDSAGGTMAGGDGRKHCVKCNNAENTNQIVM